MVYDVAIIGGGIHGVGVAQAAAVRGYKTILLEQYEHLAQGTSSRSSKLIHGGLRYLEQFEFSLVRECLLERSYLLNNAPDLVQLKPVYIPVYKHSKRSPWMIRAGLSLYALLGNFSHDARFKKVPKHKWDQLHGLKVEDLKAVYQYYEAQTDDRLLTQAVMGSAQKYGAELKVSAQVKKIVLENERCVITYSNGQGDSNAIISSTAINAGGPWAKNILANVEPMQETIDVDMVQGAHIILPIHLGEIIFYIESPEDKRPIFVMPWYGDTMIGTTESLISQDPSETYALDNEIKYLLHAFFHHFPKYEEDKPEIKSHFAGLRVLPRSKKDANKRSRETIYLRDRKHKPRLLSIFGGKLTAYRATAEHVLAYIEESLPPQKSHTDTRDLKLTRPNQ